MRSKENKESLIKYLVTNTRFSRRELTDLIVNGKVRVDGNVVQSMTMIINPHKQIVVVNDQSVHKPTALKYFKYHKPKGIICTVTDPKGRKCLDTVISEIKDPVFPVGRLDRQSSGLLILTNDGEFANKIMHPSYSVKKEYKVTVDKPLTKAILNHIRAGIILEDGPVRCDEIEKTGPTQCVIKISEGRNRIIRRIMALFDLDVIVLKRTAIGPLELGKLAPGQFESIGRSIIQETKRQMEKIMDLSEE